jgi:succinate-semialdehyde dehydrogenase / glutarate-semialdehyde dehydrogenase
MMSIASISPTNGQCIQSFEPLSDEAVQAKLAIAQQAFQSYRHTSFAQRSHWLTNAAALLRDRKQSLAQLMTLEMGKPISQSIAEIQKCALVCDYYAENAVTFLADEPALSDASLSWIKYQPLGVILVVMPWCFGLQRQH